MPPRKQGPNPLPASATGQRDGGRLLWLRLSARVVTCSDRVRLVGDGSGVEVTEAGATRIRVDNELVDLEWNDVVDESAGHAQRLVRRWRALADEVHVDLMTVRGGEGALQVGREVRVTGRDGTLLRWEEARPAGSGRQSGGLSEIGL